MKWEQFIFRVWDKKMGMSRPLFLGNTPDWSTKQEMFGLTIARFQHHWITECQIMQYIGINDSKRTDEYPDGQKIFAEDIIKVSHEQFPERDSIHCVKYYADDGYPAFDLYPALDSTANGLSEIMSEDEYQIIIMGNNLENPELFRRLKR